MFGVREIAVKRKLGVAFLALVASFSLAASADGAIILRDAATFKKLATYKSVNCAGSAKKGFTGTATNAGWKLSVRIQPFPKYKTYTLFYRPGSPAKFTVSKGAVTYSSTFSPENDPLHEKKGGLLSFPGGDPGRIGISFGTAFQVDDENSYASLFGLATCS